VAVALAREQPEYVQESTGIRKLRPMFARLWLEVEYVAENGGYW
jgi:hypothetical protein